MDPHCQLSEGTYQQLRRKTEARSMSISAYIEQLIWQDKATPAKKNKPAQTQNFLELYGVCREYPLQRPEQGICEQREELE